MYPRNAKRLTPVMRQYREAKEAYPDAILMFRLGDFYEMFNEDAVLAARELQLTLTSRNKGAPEEVPMAGVPHHAAHDYIAKLVSRGYKVAICEQLGDPSKIKGLVPRKVVRVVTPGIITDAAQLDARENNFLAALDGEGNEQGNGLALLDLSTGELLAGEVETRAMLLAELARASAREVLLPETLDELKAALKHTLVRAPVRPDAPLSEVEVATCLDEAAAVPLAADAARDHSLAAMRAAARAVRFAMQTMPDTSLPVRRVGRLDPTDTMRIDETAQKHLELAQGTDGTRHGSLLEVIDATVTAGGARLLRRRLLAPLLDVAAIRRRLDSVELFVTHPRARQDLSTALKRIGDLERLAVRATLGEATPRDLGVIRDSLAALPDALAALRSIPLAVPTTSSDDRAESADTPARPNRDDVLNLKIDPLPALRERLTAALVDKPPPHGRDGGIVREGYDSELDELRQIRQSGTELLVALESQLREQTEISSLKVKYNRVFGWYIEVTKTHLAKVPEQWRRKQTLATAERYTNENLDELADKLLHAEERFGQREAVLYSELLATVADHAEALCRLAAAVAQWDVSACLAETAHRHDYAKPEIVDDDRLAFGDGRHPVVEQFVATGKFVPNDTALELAGERLLLITGPNMAGKSTLMRQVALNVILAQMGSYVAATHAHIGIVDRILSRVGASDNLARGESTFMVEMRETASILRDATSRSLVVLDEIGRGTSTFDGLAIAWAVAEHLYENVGCRAMFATHYHELTELADRYPGIANYSVSARQHDGEIVFLHRLTPGSVSRSYGVAVARLAGLPEGVLARASAILASLEAEAHAGSAGGRTGGKAVPPTAQLDLFHPPAPDPQTATHPTCETLRNVDVNRLTPLDALQLVAKLKDMLGDED